MATRANNIARSLTAAIIGIALLAVVLAIALPRIAAEERGRRALLSLVGRIAGYDIAASTLRIGPALEIAAGGVTVGTPGMPAFFGADRISLAFTLAGLAQSRARRIEAERFWVDLEHLPASDGGDGRLPFDELVIVDGRVSGVARGLDEIRIKESVLTRDGAEGRFDIRGELGAPERGARLRWSGEAAPSGNDLDIGFEGEVIELAEILRELGLSGVDEDTKLGARATGRITGRLGGAISVTTSGSLTSPHRNEPATLAGIINLDESRDTLALELKLLPTPEVSSLAVTGEIREPFAGAAGSLALDVVWNRVSIEPFAAMLAAEQSWKLAGQGELAARITGRVSEPEAEGSISVAGLSVGFDSLRGSGDAAAAFSYRAGQLHTRAPGLTVRSLQLAAGDISAAAAEIAVTVRAVRADRGLTVVLDAAAVRELSFHDASYTLQGEGIAASGSADLALAEATSPVASFDLRVDEGEVLYKRAYLDIAAHPATVAGRVTRSPSAVGLENGSLSLEGMGTVAGALSFDGRLGLRSADAHVELPGLATFFDVLVRETLEDAHPLVGRTRIDGNAALDVRYRRPSSQATRITGRLRVADGTLAIEDPAVRATHIEVDLPIDLAGPEAEAPVGKPAGGSIRAAEAVVGGVRIAPLALPIAVATNEIESREAIRLTLAGGTVVVEHLAARELMRGTPNVSAALDFADLSLAELTGSADLPKVEGTVGGRLSRVELVGTEIATDGELLVRVFGGDVRVSNIGLLNAFSRVATLRLDAVATDIDLRAATESLGVGYMSGIAHAEVDQLEIAAGQPVRFDGWFETVRTSGVGQRISVTAINQLTILGGAGSSPITQGVLGLFDEYRYAKMGFRCSLRNDRFILHGIAEHDGKDFLVVGTWMPPTVNVISHNQVIAFKQMLSRLRQISAIE